MSNDYDGRDAEQEAWANELMLERERQALEALRKCARAGVDQQALATLARECGITDWKTNVHAGTSGLDR